MTFLLGVVFNAVAMFLFVFGLIAPAGEIWYISAGWASLVAASLCYLIAILGD